MSKTIKGIYSGNASYEVGQDGVIKIDFTNQGNEKTTIYEIWYEDSSVLFVGLLEHQVEYEEMEK